MFVIQLGKPGASGWAVHRELRPQHVVLTLVVVVQRRHQEVPQFDERVQWGRCSVRRVDQQAGRRAVDVVEKPGLDDRGGFGLAVAHWWLPFRYSAPVRSAKATACVRLRSLKRVVMPWRMYLTVRCE